MMDVATAFARWRLIASRDGDLMKRPDVLQEAFTAGWEGREVAALARVAAETAPDMDLGGVE